MTAATRFCPACGQRRAGLRCPQDGAITVERPPGHLIGRLPLPVGAEIEGRYRIEAVIGRGAFGAVYVAEQLSTGQPVALKVLLASPQGDREVAERRFHKEAQVLARLRHPATVRVFDIGETDAGDPYIAMELVDGPNLEQVMAFLQTTGRPFAEAAVLDVVIPVLGSLAEAHAHEIVHRDLKPANIMLAHVEGEGLVVKVVDFGVVRTQGSTLTGRSGALGTPKYMSPEQCRGEHVDGRADLYSLACTIFEAIAGAPPFDAANAVDTMYLQLLAPVPSLRLASVEASEALDAVVRRALAKDAAERFTDATEMRNALREIRRVAWGDVPPTSLAALVTADDLEAFSGMRETGFISMQNTEAVPRVGTGLRQVTGERHSPTARDLEAISEVVHEADTDEVAALVGRLEAAAAGQPVVATLAEEAGVADAAARDDAPRASQGARVAAAEPSAARETRARRAPTAMDTRHSPTGNGGEADLHARRLPSRAAVEAAVAARERMIAERDRVRGALDTRIEFDDERLRAVQTSPAPASTARGRGRKALGNGTVIGTGLPRRDAWVRPPAVTPEVAATSTGKGQPRRPRAAEAPPMAGAVDDDRPTVPDDLDLPDRFE